MTIVLNRRGQNGSLYSRNGRVVAAKHWCYWNEQTGLGCPKVKNSFAIYVLVCKISKGGSGGLSDKSTYLFNSAFLLSYVSFQ